MALALQDRYSILDSEYKQLIDKDNVFTQTKDIIEKTSLVTREYIAAAFLWSKASRTLCLLDIVLQGEHSIKETDRTYRRVKKLENNLAELFKLTESKCVEAWEGVFTKSPDMVQQYFFNEQLKIQKESIGVVLKEIIYYLYQAIEKENMLNENYLTEFYAVLRKMLKETYKS